MCTLAHVFEASGLSTVVITPMRLTAERMRPPRALYAEFPFGLPLGKPRDPEYQHKVLRAVLELLNRPWGPVLEDFPESIQSKGGKPLSCPLPPRYNPDLHPAVDEAQALRGAYDRAVKKNGRTSVGRVMSAADIPAAIEKFINIANGEPWDQQGFEARILMIVHDIRAYYEELAFELADGPIEPWGTERWFYDETETGKVLLEARRKIKASGADWPHWYLIAPGSRE